MKYESTLMAVNVENPIRRMSFWGTKMIASESFPDVSQGISLIS